VSSPKDLIEEKVKKYLEGFVIPTLHGLDKKSSTLSFESQISLFSKPIEVSWKEWMENFPHGVVEVREDRTNGDVLLQGIPYSDAWPLARKAGVFYSLNGFYDAPTPGHVLRRSEDNVRSYNAIWSDFDGGPEKKHLLLSKIISRPLTPTFVIETKNGYHIIYLLEKSYTDGPVWQNIQNGIIEFTDSDKACRNASRTLRMPSSWHCKGLWKDPQENPYRVALIWKGKQKYSLDDLSEYYSPKPKKKYQTRYYDQFQPSQEIKMPNQLNLPVGGRHLGLLEEAGRIYAHLDPSKALEARELIKRWYASASTEVKPNFEKEVDDICDFVERQQYGSITSR
jgi:hypothetical protein